MFKDFIPHGTKIDVSLINTHTNTHTHTHTLGLNACIQGYIVLLFTSMLYVHAINNQHSRGTIRPWPVSEGPTFFMKNK